MNQLTREQRKRRAQMLRAHHDDQATSLGDTHDYRSPREWNRQVFRLEVKSTLFHLAIKLIVVAAVAGGIYGVMKLNDYHASRTTNQKVSSDRQRSGEANGPQNRSAVDTDQLRKGTRQRVPTPGG